jgi:type IV secretory pathway VirB6-like protein
MKQVLATLIAAFFAASAFANTHAAMSADTASGVKHAASAASGAKKHKKVKTEKKEMKEMKKEEVKAQ